ncbi:MAG: tRNA guanosine(34) transglycosylase Tgt [Sedimentisphaerales bacterium]|nr:tRNA guanosine(34) transglycosylase Tgt [Sedimentisphaerales bacterium]
MSFNFEILHSSNEHRARRGRLTTPHGVIETPVFMPVGTRGAIKGILPDRIHEIGAKIVLGNTYHLLLRPGADVVARLGGLQKFSGWHGPMLTDSGGFQVFSLAGINRISDDMVEFRSHIDGSKIRLDPVTATHVQNKLGADIIMAFDECVKLPCTADRMRDAVNRTIRWAKMCQDAHLRPEEQWLFGIVQGGTDREMRQWCAEELIKLDFPGYAVGGLSVGESHEEMIETCDFIVPKLPFNKPRYLMGVGTPRDIIAAIATGVDMFDCVLPTRNGRHGFAFTSQGVIRLRNEKHKLEDLPLDPACNCYTCRNFSRGYLRHLFLCDRQKPEMTGPILVSLHNLAFFQNLMAQTRDAIEQDRFVEWAARWADYK